MSTRKKWTEQQDALLIELLSQEYNKQKKWCQIAVKIRDELKISNRTGKQCRQRWHNQLNPKVENNKDWSLKEQQQLYKLQQQYGNRWALFTNILIGRTDNNIKNFFYSALRKSLRKLNNFLFQKKRNGEFKNIKTIHKYTISKILAVADNKYLKKIQVKNNQSIILAQDLRNQLVQIQRYKLEYTNQTQKLFNEIIWKILDFNKNCKKKKNKKKQQQSEQEQNPYKQNKQEINIRNQQKQQKQQYKHEQIPKKQTILTLNSSSNFERVDKNYQYSKGIFNGFFPMDNLEMFQVNNNQLNYHSFQCLNENNQIIQEQFNNNLISENNNLFCRQFLNKIKEVNTFNRSENCSISIDQPFNTQFNYRNTLIQPSLQFVQNKQGISNFQMFDSVRFEQHKKTLILSQNYQEFSDPRINNIYPTQQILQRSSRNLLSSNSFKF